MRVLTVGFNEQNAAVINALMAERFCVAEAAEYPEDPDDLLHYLRDGQPVIAIVAPDCMDAFNKAAKDYKDYPIHVIQADNPSSIHIPTAFAELAACHGHETNGKPVLRYEQGDNIITLDMTQNHCTKNGEDVNLQNREYKILRLLLLRTGHTCTRDSIMPALYSPGQEGAELEAIDVIISRLRTKLQIPDMIRTVTGKGYTIQPTNGRQPIDCQHGPITLYKDGTATYYNKSTKTHRPIALTPTTRELLGWIIKNPERVMIQGTVKRILSSLSTAKTVSDNTAQTQITFLRDAIGAASADDNAPNGYDIIKTHIGDGYQWQNPQPRIKHNVGKKRTPIAYRPEGIILQHANTLQIDTQKGTVTNLQTGATELLTLRECEAIDYTYKHSGWKKGQEGAPYNEPIRTIRQKIAAVLAQDTPEQYIISGRETGYRLFPLLAIVNPCLVAKQNNDPPDVPSPLPSIALR
ncbi:MAG: winged helix-turn-helix domain-containing protein [Bdellovibrionales bacterium]